MSATIEMDKVLDNVKAWKYLEPTDEKSGLHRYRFEIDIDPALTKDVYTTAEKDAKKNARFPGFRPGQIPPYAMQYMKEFVVDECINQSVYQALDSYDLKEEDRADNLTVETLREDMVKSLRPGKPLNFVCEINAAPVPKEADSAEAEAEGSSNAAENVVVDVEAQQEASEAEGSSNAAESVAVDVEAQQESSEAEGSSNAAEDVVVDVEA